MDRVAELDRLDSSVAVRIVPNYFSAVHGFALPDEALWCGEREKLVDIAFRLCAALGLQSSTGFAAVRLLDRYLSSPESRRDVSRLSMAMVTCCDIMGKVVDADKSVCGHKNTMPHYYHYAYHDPGTRTASNGQSFSDDFKHMEHRIMRALRSEVLTPTPVEYVSECCPWFSSYSAASSAPVVSRKSELSNAEETLYLCNAFVHRYCSAEYSCKEIAAAATFAVTQAERDRARFVPVTAGWETSTPQLRALWSSVSWTRGKELSRKIASQGAVALEYSEGLRRVHADNKKLSPS